MAVITCAVALKPSATVQAAKPRNWAVLNVQAGPIPLPFQAAIFRRSHRNLGKKEIAADYPEKGSGMWFFRRPGDPVFRKMGSLNDRPHILVGGGIENVPLRLRSGFECSISFAMGGIWYRGMEALFTEPGTYTFQFSEGDELEMIVKETRGTDKVICNLLRTNPSLAEAMLSYDKIPEDDLLKPLQRIVTLYPKSSYANYARFALARWHAGRDGDWSAATVGDVDSQPVAALLADIDVEFAYAPHALILRFHVLQSMHFPEADEVLATLEQVHFDSSEYLVFLSGRLNQDEWNTRNPRAPRKIPVIQAKRTPVR